MAQTALEHALPAEWPDARASSGIDEVFDQHRGRQYSRELLFSTVVELVTLVSLGLRPSLHAAARAMETLPVSLAALYDKVNHTEPAILRALVRGSAERLAPVAAAVDGGTLLPGWHLRVLDGNHLPASEKRLAAAARIPWCGAAGADAGGLRPGQRLGHRLGGRRGRAPERACFGGAIARQRAAGTAVDRSEIAKRFARDRYFCTRTVMGGLDEARAGFIVREHGANLRFRRGCHPRLARQGAWRECGRTETGQLREQPIEVAGAPAPWRRIELALDTLTEAGERVIRLWSNLPEEIGAGQIATLYRTRWRIEGMFQRLEAVLHSEIRSLGHPRAALLGFAVAVLAHNVLALLQRCVEQAPQGQEPPPEVSTYYLALHVRGGYEGMLIALPPEQWRSSDGDPAALADRLLQLARNIDPRQVATSKRGPKVTKPKGYVDGATARAHVATARILTQARATTPCKG